MEIYFIRHGQTDYNLHNITQGCKDIPLNETGRRQAQEAAEALKSIDFDYIYSSPLCRALETAEIINQYKHQPIITEKRLCERSFNVLEGTASKQIDMASFFDFEANLSEYGVETIKSFIARVSSFLDEIHLKYGNTNKKILLVSHNGVHIAMYCYYNGVPDNLLEYGLYSCEYSIFNGKNQIKKHISNDFCL